MEFLIDKRLNIALFSIFGALWRQKEREGGWFGYCTIHRQKYAQWSIKKKNSAKLEKNTIFTISP